MLQNLWKVQKPMSLAISQVIKPAWAVFTGHYSTQTQKLRYLVLLGVDTDLCEGRPPTQK